MIIAVDKKSYKVAEDDGNRYIYLYDDEELESLMETRLRCIYYKDFEYADINLTNYNIDCMKRANINDDNWKSLPEKKYFKIGIIIPNCNYEHTIEKCLNSIFNQTYQNFEIIFVDDVSTDKSVQIASKTYCEYLGKNKDADEFGELKIIKLKQKRYNGGARNEAYLHLSDDVDYVYYVDSDDWLYDENVLEKINNKLQSEPDVLFVGIAEYKKGKIRESSIPDYKDKYEAINGWSGSCGKVIKKELAIRQECLYNEGTLKEDKNQHCKVCINMKTFNCLKDFAYVWNKENYKSVTTVRENIIWGTSTIRHYADTLQLYLTYKGKDDKIDEILKNRVELCKKEILEGNDRQW